VGFTFIRAEEQEIGFPRTLGIGDNDVCRDGRFHGYPPALLLRYGRLCIFDAVNGMGLGYTKAAMVCGRTRVGHRGRQRVTRSAVVPVTYTNAKEKNLLPSSRHHQKQGSRSTTFPPNLRAHWQKRFRQGSRYTKSQRPGPSNGRFRRSSSPRRSAGRRRRHAPHMPRSRTTKST